MTDKIKRFIYADAKGRVTYREVTDWTETATHLQAIDPANGYLRTFRVDRILEHDPSLHGIKIRIAQWQAKVPHDPKAPTPTIRRSIPGVLEVCFTGFKATDKSRLADLAIAAGFLVRDAVTSGLHVLCYGYNAGPAKLAKARAQNVLILTEDQFLAFKDTGEIPMDAEPTETEPT